MTRARLTVRFLLCIRVLIFTSRFSVYFPSEEIQISGKLIVYQDICSAPCNSCCVWAMVDTKFKHHCKNFLFGLYALTVTVYLLAISTGAAASDNMAYVKLVGDQGSTDFIAVDNIAIDNWEPHS